MHAIAHDGGALTAIRQSQKAMFQATASAQATMVDSLRAAHVTAVKAGLLPHSVLESAEFEQGLSQLRATLSMGNKMLEALFAI